MVRCFGIVYALAFAALPVAAFADGVDFTVPDHYLVAAPAQRRQAAGCVPRVRTVCEPHTRVHATRNVTSKSECDRNDRLIVRGFIAVRRTFVEMYPIVWTIVFAVLIVGGLGVGSILLIPLAVLLIPYYLVKPTYLRAPTRFGIVVYVTTVAAMTTSLGLLLASFYGFNL